jgi:hypothetical protein
MLSFSHSQFSSTQPLRRTFTCPNQCDELCNASEKEKYLFKLSELYPGLTMAERALASQEPVKTLKAYQLSWRAESMCLKKYPTSSHNDESDACRHFIWSSLLTKEFGREFTEKVLYAHEQEPTQPENEKAMDLANNQRGISVAEKLIKDKSFSDEKIFSELQEQFKQGRLIVFKKMPFGGRK